MTGDPNPQFAFGDYQKVRFFGSLNGLRCLCIVLVLFHHAGPLHASLPEWRILTRGFTGVDFFFVLSGFLITTLLLREEARTGRISLPAFYMRRILRIFPLYFLIVFLAAVWWIGVRGEEKWWAFLPYYIFFLANFLTEGLPILGAIWSLSVEEQYYLLWPLLLLLTAQGSWLRVCVVTGLIIIGIIAALGFFGPLEILPPTHNAEFFLPVASFQAILLGSISAIVLNNPTGFAVAWRFLGHRFTPVVLFGSLILVWELLPPALLGWPNLVMHMNMTLLLVSLVIREDHFAAWVLMRPTVARIGEISYGVYLWHLIGLHIGNEISAAMGFEGVIASWVALPFYLAATFIISEISFRYFESFFLRLKPGSRGISR